MSGQQKRPPRPRAARPTARTKHPLYSNATGTVRLYQGNCLEILPSLEEFGSVRLIFADPPYFLSNDGITCHAGKMVSVNKGAWDRLESVDRMHTFNLSWVEACRKALVENGSLWVSGTRHVIYSVGFAMQQLEMKLLNEIAWEKPNPPPNLSCRYFTHSTETLIWAAKTKKSRHIFNYQEMRAAAGGKQMKSVWRIPSPASDEKTFGKHPTQKPLALLERIIKACTHPGDLVLDPFSGSATTGVAAIRTNRRFVGIELDANFADVAVRRLVEADKQLALAL